jgi:hypothetical protein
MTFGITGDYDTTPDLELLARGIEDGAADLLKTSPLSSILADQPFGDPSLWRQTLVT